MIRRFYPFIMLLILLLCVSFASAQEEQYPIMQKLAQKVIQKYQASSCQELAMKKSQPATGQKAAIEKRVIEMLRNDPQMRTEFINQVAPSIANKLFECGMIP